jgi:hypothetical protein
MDVLPYESGESELAKQRARLRSLAEQGVIDPAQLDDQLAALESGDPNRFALAGLGANPAGYLPSDPLMLHAGGSAENRSGRWTIPPFLSIRAGAANVRLNCLHAVWTAPVIQVELSKGLGNVLLILPEGWAVNADRVTKGLGSLVLKVPDQPAPNCPLFVVRGSLSLGNFKARPASRWELRRAAKLS